MTRIVHTAISGSSMVNCNHRNRRYYRQSVTVQQLLLLATTIVLSISSLASALSISPLTSVLLLLFQQQQQRGVGGLSAAAADNNVRGAVGGSGGYGTTAALSQTKRKSSASQRRLIYNVATGIGDSKVTEDHHKDDKIPPCQDVTLVLLLDAYPNEIGYSLVCNKRKTVLWNVTEGSMMQYQAFGIIQETALCVQPTSTCVFTITDTNGQDGLTTVEANSRAGYFVLLYGNNTVAAYDGSIGYPESYFTELSYCFGPECEDKDEYNKQHEHKGGRTYQDDVKEEDMEQEELQPPTYVGTGGNGDSNPPIACEGDDEVLLQLYLTVDEFPTETSYTLKCISKSDSNSETIVWDAPPGTFPAVNPFASYYNSTCLRLGKNSTSQQKKQQQQKEVKCCTFTIKDSWGDGITSPQDNVPGSFQLLQEDTNAVTNSIALYDGSNPNVTISNFDELAYYIGWGCPSPK